MKKWLFTPLIKGFIDFSIPTLSAHYQNAGTNLKNIILTSKRFVQNIYFFLLIDIKKPDSAGVRLV